jgi:hypothetical protein
VFFRRLPQESTACIVKDVEMPAVSIEAVAAYPITVHLLAHIGAPPTARGIAMTRCGAYHIRSCGTTYTPSAIRLKVMPLPAEADVHTYCSDTSNKAQDWGRLMVAVVSAFAAGAAESILISTLFETVSEKRSAVPTFLILNVCTPVWATAMTPEYLAENVAEKV